MRNHRSSQIQCLLCQKSTKLSEKNGQNLEKMARFYSLREGRVSLVLEEEIQNRPINIRFLESGPESDCQSSRIESGRVVG